MRKILIISGVVVALIVALAGGYFWGYARGGAAVTASYAPKIVTVGRLFPAAPTSTLSLSGQVAAINGSVITLDANPPTQNPFAVEDFPTVRTVTITSSTAIIKTEQTAPAEFQKEMQVYEKQMTGASVPPPSPFTETSTTLSDITVGNVVTVTADSDIMSAPSFTATAIQAQPTP